MFSKNISLQVEKEKERYEREMKNYKPPPGYEDNERKSKGKKKKDPNAPKRAITAFMFYSTKIRPIIKKEQPDRRH